MNRIVTIQDISCVGKCSLTVALPVISAMGVETSVIPTAVLSTHTAFNNFTYHDLTNEIEPIASHWKDEKIDFDAIYTGYLGSFEQLNIVSNFIDDFKTEDNIVFIDPVMGDHGQLYKGFDKEFAKEMGKLVGKADVVVPNLTEASYILDIPYVEKGYDEQHIKDILIGLTDLGANYAALTGVSFKANEVGVMSYDARNGVFFTYYSEKRPVAYHGTGDVFASTAVGALMKCFSLEEALKIAVDFTVESIDCTINDPNRRWYGVNFEEAIPYLINRISK